MNVEQENAIYPVQFVRESCCQEYGIPEATWYLHAARMPQPDLQMSGWDWYSWQQFQEVRTWWANRPSVKRRLSIKVVGV